MTDDRTKQIAQLNIEITALRTAIASLATLPEARCPLEATLAAKEQELAALHGEVPPATRNHSQDISGSAKVGTAIAGDVYGPVSSTNQSGGVNFGSGNQIGSMGDVVAGDQHVTEGPRVYGPVTAQRDVNIATDQTITNAEPTGPSVTPATVPIKSKGRTDVKAEESS